MAIACQKGGVEGGSPQSVGAGQVDTQDIFVNSILYRTQSNVVARQASKLLEREAEVHGLASRVERQLVARDVLVEADNQTPWRTG